MKPGNFHAHKERSTLHDEGKLQTRRKSLVDFWKVQEWFKGFRLTIIKFDIPTFGIVHPAVQLHFFFIETNGNPLNSSPSQAVCKAHFRMKEYGREFLILIWDATPWRDCRVPFIFVPTSMAKSANWGRPIVAEQSLRRGQYWKEVNAR